MQPPQALFYKTNDKTDQLTDAKNDPCQYLPLLLHTLLCLGNILVIELPRVDEQLALRVLTALIRRREERHHGADRSSIGAGLLVTSKLGSGLTAVAKRGPATADRLRLAKLALRCRVARRSLELLLP